MDLANASSPHLGPLPEGEGVWDSEAGAGVEGFVEGGDDGMDRVPGEADQGEGDAEDEERQEPFPGGREAAAAPEHGKGQGA